MERIPQNQVPTFATTTRVERDGAGGIRYTLYLNLQNRTVGHVEVWAREERFGLAALEAGLRDLQKRIGGIVVPEVVQ